MPHVIAYSAHNRVFGAAWRKTVVEKQRAALGKILERGVKDRQLTRGLDSDLGIAILVGPMIYRRIFLNSPGDLAPLNFAEQVVDAFWKAFAFKPQHGRAGWRLKKASNHPLKNTAQKDSPKYPRFERKNSDPTPLRNPS